MKIKRISKSFHSYQHLPRHFPLYIFFIIILAKEISTEQQAYLLELTLYLRLNLEPSQSAWVSMHPTLISSVDYLRVSIFSDY